METSRKTTDELLELLKQKKSFDEYLQEGPEFVDMGLPWIWDGAVHRRDAEDAEDIRISDSVCKEQKRQHHFVRTKEEGIPFRGKRTFI